MSAPKIIKRTPDLGLKIRLQPVAEAGPAAAPAGGCPCEATGVAWLAKAKYYDGDWPWWGSPINESVNEAVGQDESGGFIMEGPQPETFITHNASYYYDGDPPGLPDTFVAAATGPEVRGVQWSAERVGNEQFDIDIDTTGPTAWVTINPVNISDLSAGYANITLTARCGDAVVGVLRLQVRHEAW